MVEFKELLPMAVVLISLAAIVLGGLAVIGQYREILKDSTEIENESISMVSQIGTLDNDDVTSVTFFGNNTNSTNDGGITINVNVNWSSNGTIIVDGTIFDTDDDYNISYVYDADTEASNSATNFITGISIFGAFVGVLVISVIGKVIVGLFGKKN